VKEKSKAIALASLIVLAVVSLPVATALAGEFHSEASHTILSGSQIGEDLLTFNAGTIRCFEINYSGTQSSATSTTIRVIPTYTSCTAGIPSVQIDTNGCEFEFSGDNTQFNIVNCSSPLTITSFSCWITIGNQSGLSAIGYTNTNSGSSRDMDISANVSGITYTQHSKSFPGCSGGTRTDGKWVGAFTLRGSNTEGAQVGIWRE
jgi:hypothetical protein